MLDQKGCRWTLGLCVCVCVFGFQYKVGPVSVGASTNPGFPLYKDHACHGQTHRRKWKEVVTAITALRGKKIQFHPSELPKDQIFLLTVDGVNFSIQEPRAKSPGS